jgi:hypothetical protein
MVPKYLTHTWLNDLSNQSMEVTNKRQCVYVCEYMHAYAWVHLRVCISDRNELKQC